MHIEPLVRMANDIGAYFATADTQEEREQGVLSHIKRYWDPRMRARIIEHYHSGAAGLSGHVLAAIALLAKEVKEVKIDPRVRGGDGSG